MPVGDSVADMDSEGVSVMPKLRPLALTAILVCLIPSATHPLKENPILVLRITVSDPLTDNVDVKSIRSSLEIDSKWITAFDCIKRLVEIGTAFSEVSVQFNDEMSNSTSYS